MKKILVNSGMILLIVAVLAIIFLPIISKMKANNIKAVEGLPQENLPEDTTYGTGGEAIDSGYGAASTPDNTIMDSRTGQVMPMPQSDPEEIEMIRDSRSEQQVPVPASDPGN